MKRYAAPWAEPLVQATGDVELVEYGPSAPTQARQWARHRDWAWRPTPKRPRPVARDLVAAYLREAGAEITAREREVFALVHVQGHSTRWAARALGISRSAVATYLRRLRARAARYRATRDIPRPTRAAQVLARHAAYLGRQWRDLRAGAVA